MPIEYDGVSATLKIIAPIHTGENTITIGIADTGDHVYDSGIFISNLAAGTIPGTGVFLEGSGTTSSQGNLSGGAASDLLIMQTSDTSVNAGSGDDVVVGNTTNNVIAGGMGSDVLEGGGGADEFDYTSLDDWAANGMDTITDFVGNTATLSNASNLDAINGDVLVFNYAALAGITGAVMDGFVHPSVDHNSTLGADYLSTHIDGTADQGHAQFVYDAASGIVSFDADGSGLGNAVQITMIGNHPSTLVATDFVIVG